MSATRFADRVSVRLFRGAAIAAFCCGATAAIATEGERVRFPSIDIDPIHGTPIMLDGLFFTPDPSAGGFPTVIALHGCDGMYSTLASRQGKLSARHQAMADLLVAEGYAVLFPDSFNPRGRREVCTVPTAEQTIVQANRRLDVLGALEYLRTRNDVARQRIALLGWSHGGSAVLATMNARSPTVIAYRAHLADIDTFFVTAIAFYPGCNPSLRDRDGYAPAAPLSIFIGEADDWTSVRPCVALGKRMAAQGSALEVRTYPDTYHGFDNPSMRRPIHLDVPNGVYPGQGVTVASNRAARDDAYARMKAQLRAALMP